MSEPIDLPDRVVVAPPVTPRITMPPPEPSALLVVPTPGPEGPPGPPGDEPGQVRFFRDSASGVVSAHRVVTPNPDGSIRYASADNPDDLGVPLWLTTASGQIDIEVCAFGPVDEPSWSWDIGLVYLGADGVLTQIRPSPPAFAAVVGYATGPNSLFFDSQVNLAVLMATTSRYVHTQVSPSASWVIDHGLSKNVHVSVFDSVAPPWRQVFTDVDHGSIDQVTLTFPVPTVGVAVLS